MWDHLMIGLIAYTVIYAPYRTAFMIPETSTVLYIFETMTDLLLLVDVVLSFLTHYERLDGTYETNIKKMTKNYVLGSLLFDLVAVFPT